jgi:prepilin-type N-terminal cleavage/methylation domain-containing protein
MRKSDDRGFTLVELLVAVTILAIIIIPLLGTFVTVTRTNTRAKNKLAATMAGQNLLEELKASDVESFMTGATSIEVLDSDSKPVLDEQGNQIFILEKSFDRQVDGKDYHMVMRLDPTNYTTVSGETKKETDYNSIEYSDLTSLSNSSSAFLFVTGSDTVEAASELLLIEPQSALPGMIESDDERKQEIAARMTRDVDVKIEKSATSSATIVTSTITYHDGTYSYTTRDEEIYNNGTSMENQLSSIYICFEPMYNNSVRGTATETITIDNTVNQKVSVFLVKQASETVTDAAAEAKYSVNVKVLGSSSTPETSIVTNMDYTEGNADNEMLLSYSGSTLNPGDRLTDVLHVSAGDQGLQKPSTENRIYDVSIKIYRLKNDGGAAAYEEKDLLTTLDGTKME